jgi:hypothetical protein
VLPAQVFREALDTELISLMSVLFHPDKDRLEQSDSEAARQAIHQLVRQSISKSFFFRVVCQVFQ